MSEVLTTLKSVEALNKNNRIEVIKFMTIRKLTYNIQNYFNCNACEHMKIPTIQSVYTVDAFSIIIYILAGFYEKYQ